MKQKTIISIKNLCKRFNQQVVLDDINLNIYKGEITGIIGRNGSGKTVLLKIIAGLYFESSGTIVYDNEELLKEQMGVLIDTGFLDNETGMQNLMILAELRNIVDKKDIYDILSLVGLQPECKTKYKNYSTGMKQKLKIAQAIMERPKFLILDEPFNGLDKKSVEYFRRKFKEMKAEGTTIIITSHYQEDIDELCDRVYEMVDGKLKFYEEK